MNDRARIHSALEGEHDNPRRCVMKTGAGFQCRHLETQYVAGVGPTCTYHRTHGGIPFAPAAGVDAAIALRMKAVIDGG